MSRNYTSSLPKRRQGVLWDYFTFLLRDYKHNLLTEERAAYADISLKDEIPPTQGSFSFSEDEVQRHIQNI
jgi:hypothetical protein